MQTTIRWKKIGLNNHIKNAKSENLTLAYKHFNEPNHNPQQHAEFTVK